MWKRFVHDYLSYSHKERTGVFILLALVIASIITPFFYPYFIADKQYDHHKFDADIARLQLAQPDSFNNKNYSSDNNNEDDFNNHISPSEKNYYTKSIKEVFYFDPNTASSLEWKRLGIRDKTTETIQKYLSKGGHFYKPEDISKIWGLHAEDIKRLLPYVRIAKTTGYVKKEQPQFVETKRLPYAVKTSKTIDINTADTAEFILLPGIGSKLAQRIINFRNKLGGFYSVDQVAETFGLPDSTFKKIKPRLIISPSSIIRINVNTASLEDLKIHPYIRYNLANAIIQYRNQHGNFSSITDIKKIMLFTDEVYKKVEPYISIN
jgi:competence protein ComEA